LRCWLEGATSFATHIEVGTKLYGESLWTVRINGLKSTD
jgi:hypothetical protein